MGIIIECNCSKENKFTENLEICNQNNEIFIENNNNKHNNNFIECNIDLEKIKLKNKFTSQNQTLKSNNFSLSPKIINFIIIIILTIILFLILII